MKRYKKLISAIAGNVVGIVVAVAIFYGVGSESAGCAPDVDGECIRTVFGLTAEKLTAVVLGVVNSLSVWRGPANEA